LTGLGLAHVLAAVLQDRLEGEDVVVVHVDHTLLQEVKTRLQLLHLTLQFVTPKVLLAVQVLGEFRVRLTDLVSGAREFASKHI